MTTTAARAETNRRHRAHRAAHSKANRLLCSVVSLIDAAHAKARELSEQPHGKNCRCAWCRNLVLDDDWSRDPQDILVEVRFAADNLERLAGMLDSFTLTTDEEDDDTLAIAAQDPHALSRSRT